MSDETRYFHHPGTADKSTALEIMSDAGCTAAWQEIRRWPGYQQTPLYDWSALAQKLGLRKVYYKDESSRFDIGSFKALGGAYAVRKLAAEHFGIPLDELKRNRLPAQHDFCVITATDGNHGRSVACGARSVDITEETLMAGLSCGEISIVAWNVLKDFDVDYLHIGEDLVVPSMELIAAQGIEASETSAATPAGLCAAMDDPALSAPLGLDADATVLLFGTEGATDPAKTATTT